MVAKAKLGKTRSVDSYINALVLAKKSAITVRDYRLILKVYSKWLGVPVENLHQNLNSDDLMRYARKLDADKIAPVSRRKYLMVIARFMQINNIEFDDLEQGAINAFQPEERNDKPATKELLQSMMDMGDPHSRAIISFLTSTGCRAGETSQILLSDIGRIEHGNFVPDINGGVVRIRNEIAKRRKGGLVFLSSESREYLTIWLQNRDDYIRMANTKSQNLRKGNTGRAKGLKHAGEKITRPAEDQRLFACSYYTLSQLFGKLYSQIDGEKGKYDKNMVTPHGCRAFFRTNAAKTMGIDLTEGILRHSGYLNQAYVRMTPEDRENQFHEGEASLYITRADHRIQGGKLDALARENKELQGRLQQVEAATMLVKHERAAIRAAGSDFVKAEDVERMVREAVAAALRK
jgi:integrase